MLSLINSAEKCTESKNDKGRYIEMDDGDSTDTTCMCNALTVVRAFHYIS